MTANVIERLDKLEYENKSLRKELAEINNLISKLDVIGKKSTRQIGEDRIVRLVEQANRYLQNDIPTPNRLVREMNRLSKKLNTIYFKTDIDKDGIVTKIYIEND